MQVVREAVAVADPVDGGPPMSDVTEATVRCWGCDGSGHWTDPNMPGRRVWCGWCRGTGEAVVVLGCNHEDTSWSGYGDVEDSQWDGANECDACRAVFAVWPREVPWPPPPRHPHTCSCGDARMFHRAFTDECIVHECGCSAYDEVTS